MNNIFVRLMRLASGLAVVGALFAGVAIIVVGLITVAKSIWDLIDEGDIGLDVLRSFSVDIIEVADAFLLGIVMFIVAAGVYQLFIDGDVEVPPWLKIGSLTDLKEDLLAVTIVLMGISFLGRVFEWEGDKNIIYYGVAIAAVLVPLVVMYGLLFRFSDMEDEVIAEEKAERKEAPQVERVAA